MRLFFPALFLCANLSAIDSNTPLHTGSSLAISGLTSTFIWTATGKQHKLASTIVGFSLATTVGMAVEAMDAGERKASFDWGDMTANLIGAGIGSILFYSIVPDDSVSITPQGVAIRF